VLDVCSIETSLVMIGYERRLKKIGPAEIRAFYIAPIEFGVVEIGPDKSRHSRTPSIEICVPQIGAGQIDAVKIAVYKRKFISIESLAKAASTVDPPLVIDDQS
jgi:hypothetical protein